MDPNETDGRTVGRTATIRNAATQGRLHNKVDYLLEEMITRNPTCEVRTL